MKKRFLWNKGALKKMVRMSKTASLEKVATELGVSSMSVTAMARRFKQAGMEVKFQNGRPNIGALIKEIVTESK